MFPWTKHNKHTSIGHVIERYGGLLYMYYIHIPRFMANETSFRDISHKNADKRSILYWFTGDQYALIRASYSHLFEKEQIHVRYLLVSHLFDVYVDSCFIHKQNILLFKWVTLRKIKWNQDERKYEDDEYLEIEARIYSSSHAEPKNHNCYCFSNKAWYFF